MNSDKREPMDFSVNDSLEPATDQPEVVLDEDFELPAVEVVEATAETSTPPALPPPANDAETAAEFRRALPAPSTIRPTVGPPDRLIWAVATAASVLWAMLSVYAIGYQWPPGAVDFQPYRFAVLVAFAAVPIAFIWIGAYGLIQGLKIASSAARTNALAEQTSSPRCSARPRPAPPPPMCARRSRPSPPPPPGPGPTSWPCTTPWPQRQSG